MNWKQSVLIAIKRLSKRKGRRTFTRQELILEELDKITAEVGSQGKTPEQTLSRILQELREENEISFDSPGTYSYLPTSSS